MITITTHCRHNFLRKYGIFPLTGEACGLNCRSLCDITEEGKELLSQILGLTDLAPASAWNCEEGTIGSIMLPYALMTTVLLFGLIQHDKCHVVFDSDQGLIGCQTEEEVEQIRGLDHITVEREYRLRGTGRDGTRNVHEFSGREV